MMKREYSTIILPILIAILYLFQGCGSETGTQKTGLLISEFMAANVNTKMDPDFRSFGDWIELYNSSDQPIDTGGYRIGKSKEQEGWEIPSVTIPPKGFMVLWADKHNSGIHTDFSLKSQGDSLYLFDRDDALIDSVTFGKQKADISEGRNLKSLKWGYMLPSFGHTNLPLRSENRIVEPVFSVAGGFYDTSFKLTLENVENATIYYTLDGSIPTEKSQKYTTPILIDQTTVVKAVAYKDSLLPSKTVSETFFIGENTFHESALPVVSLSVNPDYLFDPDYGIYVEGIDAPSPDSLHCKGTVSDEYNYAQEWERPAFIQYFDKDEKPRNFRIGADLSIAGECSRQYPKKSFSLEFKKKYGEGKLHYKLYPQKDIDTFKDMKLRAGSNGYRFVDILGAALVAEGKLNIDYQAFRIVHLFVNGEYWGIYRLREKKGADFIKSNYPQVDKKELDIISVDEVKAGDSDDYEQLRYFVNHHDLSVEANYQEVVRYIDMDNFIDYMSFMIYSGQSDWISNNTRLWKEKKPDAKWRWILDDVDGGFQAWSLPHDNFQRIAEKPDYFTSELFTALSKNSTFKQRFTQRLIQLMDTLFASENIIRHIQDIATQEQKYMKYEKWAKALSKKEKTVEGFQKQFEKHIQSMIRFAKERKAIVLEQLNNYR